MIDIHPGTFTDLRRVLVTLSLISAVWSGPAFSEDQTSQALSVVEAAISTGVVNLAPVGPGVSFSADVGRLYCFTRITTTLPRTHVKHLWFHGDMMVMETVLPVNSSNWRTYSMKTILPSATGDWRVDVTSEDGTILTTLNFTIR